MIQYDGAPAPAPDPYQEAIDDMSKWLLEEMELEIAYHQAAAKRQEAWARVCLLREQRERKGN